MDTNSPGTAAGRNEIEKRNYHEGLRAAFGRNQIRKRIHREGHEEHEEKQRRKHNKWKRPNHAGAER